MNIQAWKELLHTYLLHKSIAAPFAATESRRVRELQIKATEVNEKK
jgi:hypothetical protein